MADLDDSANDPCRADDTYSAPRALGFVMLFLSMFGGGIFVIFSDSFVGTLLGSVLGYTACVMVYGFSRNKNRIRPYLFTCPVVVSQYPRLFKRHAIFLAALATIVTIALQIKPHPSSWMHAPPERGAIPFYFMVAIPVGALALPEIMTNRGVLERAHNDRFGEPASQDDTDRDGTLSIFRQDQ